MLPAEQIYASRCNESDMHAGHRCDMGCAAQAECIFQPCAHFALAAGQQSLEQGGLITFKIGIYDTLYFVREILWIVFYRPFRCIKVDLPRRCSDGQKLFFGGRGCEIFVRLHGNLPIDDDIVARAEVIRNIIESHLLFMSLAGKQAFIDGAL